MVIFSYILKIIVGTYYFGGCKMSRKVLLTKSRLEKRLEGLKKEGFVFEKELLICNKSKEFDEPTKIVLRTLGVSIGYLEYPLSEVYLILNKKDKTCIIGILADKDGRGKLSLDVYGLSELESDERYVLDYGDAIPSSGMGGEPLVSFELCSGVPMFSSLLRGIGLLPQGFNSIPKDSNLVYLNSGITSVFKSLYDWKYTSMMLNSDVSNAVFRFSSIDLERVLNDLYSEGYTLVSLGIIGVRSIVGSVTVCGFKKETGYVYVSFYYGVEEEEFLVRFWSTPFEQKSVCVEGRQVYMYNISVRDKGDTSTLIRGFDFENFETHHVI